MAETKTKAYILLGEHRTSDGKVHQRGETIRLNDRQANSLVNKVVLANSADSKLSSEVAKLTKQLADQETKNRELEKQLEDL